MVTQNNHYNGTFSVLLTDKASTDNAASVPGVVVGKEMVTVPSGSFSIVDGGIECHYEKRRFYWNSRYVRQIKDGDGNLLWQNLSPNSETAK